MKIFLLTPIYVTATYGTGATPVVHYFAKEWVKQGHEVYVFNLRAKYPSIYYWVSKQIHHLLYSKTGIPVPSQIPIEFIDVYEGVNVQCVCMKKVIPHSEYKHSQIEYAINVISNGCVKYGIPDVFIGHWDNPQLHVLNKLKELYHRPTTLVLHNNDFNLEKTYGIGVVDLLKKIDTIGFRSIVGKNNFEAKYFVPNHSFIASSGVSDNFIQIGKDFSPTFKKTIHSYIFVGSLISRKYPCEILKALLIAHENKNFKVTFIGDGNEQKNIEKFAKGKGLEENVTFTGRIGRDKIIEYLKNAEVFIMISANEIFGLVYLEAMALGLIPIGSKNEGIDGIIRDGENGFLCNAGDVNELAEIIKRLHKMSSEQLIEISKNAKSTALEYTDSNVASKYLENLKVR